MNPSDPPRPSRRPLSIPATPLKVSIDLSATELALAKYKSRALGLAASEVNAARLDVTHGRDGGHGGRRQRARRA